MSKKLTVGSLFAGIGGVCTAFKQAGMEVVWANEVDQYACKTYRENFDTINPDEASIRYPNQTILYEHDITKIVKTGNVESDIINLEDIPKVDIITSGFPCQAFSVAGYREGFNDRKGRGNLFFDTVRFIQEIQPQAFLLENVRNLVGHDKGKTFNIIRKVISSSKDETIDINGESWSGLGYSFIPFVLNAKDYCNVPQTRTRIYIVGFKDEAYLHEGENHLPLNTSPIDYNPIASKKGFAESLTAKFKIPDPVEETKPIEAFLEEGKGGSEGDFYIYIDYKDGVSVPNNKLKDHYVEALMPLNNRQTIYQWRRHYVRENQSNACPTLTANMGTGGHNVPIVYDELKRVRRLSPKECLNFQGFPAEYKFPLNMGKAQRYKQAGNSVVVPVVKYIADAIKHSL